MLPRRTPTRDENQYRSSPDAVRRSREDCLRWFRRPRRRRPEARIACRRASFRREPSGYLHEFRPRNQISPAERDRRLPQQRRSLSRLWRRRRPTLGRETIPTASSEQDSERHTTRIRIVHRQTSGNPWVRSDLKASTRIKKTCESTHRSVRYWGTTYSLDKRWHTACLIELSRK